MSVSTIMTPPAGWKVDTTADTLRLDAAPPAPALLALPRPGGALILEKRR